MKKLFWTLCCVIILFGSCSEDNTITPETTTADFTLEHNEWKTATLTNEIITNQQNISHYGFDILQLEKLIAQEEVNYIWFDLGLNTKNQITFTATGVNSNEITIDQVTSKIISTGKNKTNINVLQQVKGVETGYTKKETHILRNEEAYNYITSMNKASNNFKKGLTSKGLRVESIGFDAVVIDRILNTKGAKSIALFLGQNKKQEITTVLIAKDSDGNLLINNSSDIQTSGRAFDDGHRRPPSPSCGGCADYCEWPIWICCVAESPCENEN
jgi:hypothetical protein